LECLVFAPVARWSWLIFLGVAAMSPALGHAQAVDEPGNTVGRALQQPFRDLNLIRSHTAPVLEQAMVDPYDARGLDDCTSVGSRIDELESVLGPDIDQPRSNGPSAASQVAAGAVDNIVGLPFGGIVRHLTGAYSQDLAHRRAVLAGMVRRGYLNGIWRTMGCDRSKIAGPARPPPEMPSFSPPAPSPSIEPLAPIDLSVPPSATG
jgi:hypothetical protein